MERNKAIETIQKMYDATDSKNWMLAQECFTDSVLMDFTSVNGGKPTYRTPREITYVWSGFDSLLHKASAFDVSLKKNNAIVTWTGHTIHNFNKKIWIVDANYEATLVKLNDEWRIATYKINLIEQSGDLTLPKQAAEKQTK